MAKPEKPVCENIAAGRGASNHRRQPTHHRRPRAFTMAFVSLNGFGGAVAATDDDNSQRRIRRYASVAVHGVV